MKTVVLCLAVLGLSQAVPSGVYHQEYNYKTSASAYRNNELQHKTDDEGYYSKDGDLEGRVKPKVHANSEHSEYINPKLQDYNTGFYGGSNGDTSSYGHLKAENTYGGVGSAGYGAGGSGYGSQSQYGGQYQSEGLASSDHISGAYGSYGSSSQNSYGSVSSASANLRQITSRLEQQLQRELQDAIYRNSYYSQSDLENELRRNLSQRITDELATQFGQQSIRGGMSYTITGGRVQPTANYQQQDLESLKRQVEDHLLQTLRSEYQRKSSGSVSASQHNEYNRNYVYQTTTYRPVPTYTNYPVAPPSRGQIGQQPVDTRPAYHPDSEGIYHNGGSSNTHSYNSESSSYQRTSNVRYTPVPNPESITTIASSVQHQMDEKLNRLLDDAQRQYFSQDTRYTLQSLDSILDRLKNELRSNITYHLDEAIRRQYGNQIQRDGYMYTLGPNGQFSDLQNYRIADLDSLRRQVETNLIEKLDRDFQNYRTRFQTQSNHQTYTNQENRYNYNEYTTARAIPFHHGVSTPLYDQEYYQPGRPTSPSIVPTIGAGIKGGHYNNYITGSSHGGYEASSSVNNVAELQRQLQTDLNRQLQAALTRQRYEAQAYTRSGQSLPSYDVSYQRILDELNRNLTRQLDEYESSSAYRQYGSSSRGIGEAQLASLRSQLQQSLAGQLQQGLRQSYSSSSSYSASASSSSSGASGGYRQARGSDYNTGLGAYGQYRSGGGYTVQNEGEDCLGDDPNAYQDNYRAKRSYDSGSYGSASYGYRSRPLGLSTHAGAGSNYGASGSGSLGRNQPLAAQSEDDSYLTQQVEDPDFDQTADNHQDLTQQVEHPDFGQTPDYHQDLTQQIEGHGYEQIADDNEDLTQQQEGHGFGQLTVGHNQNLQREDHGHGLGQAADDSEGLTQQTEDHGVLQGQQLQEIGQEFDDQDLTQQVEEVRAGTLQLGEQVQTDLGQHVDNNGGTGYFGKPKTTSKPFSEVYQDEDDEGIGHLEFGQQRPRTDSHPVQSLYGQKLSDESLELSQQVETEDFQNTRPVQSLYVQKPVDENLELTQKVETENFQNTRPVQSLYVQKPVDENLDLTQQVETDDFKHTNQLNGHQELGYTDWLAKQSENENSGKLSSSSQVNLNTQNPDDDLAQHVEQEDFGKLQSGSQVNSNKLNDDQQVQIPTNDDDLLQQQLDNISEKLEGNVRKPNALFLEQTQEKSSTPSWSNLNVRPNSTTSKPYVAQAVPDESYTSTAFLNLQTPTQTKIKQKLEETVRKQLQQALNAVFDSGTVEKHSYQRLSVELCNNISRTIEKNLIEDYTFSTSFDKTELRKLQSQLEYELKKELKLNLDAYNNQHFGQTSNSDDTSDTQQQENVFPQPQIPQQPLINPGVPSGNTGPNGYRLNRHPWDRRPFQRQNSFLDRERNQNNHYFRPLNPSPTPLSGAQHKPYNSPETPPSWAQSKPYNSPETPLSGTQSKPWSDDLVQQEELPETADGGLTQQQEDLGPKPPGLGQENVGSSWPKPDGDLVLPAVRPPQQNGYGGHHRDYYHHQSGTTWNAVPPKYVPYSERQNPGKPFNPVRPAAEYQIPPSQYPQPGYQTPNAYPYQTQFQVGQPEYIPRPAQPTPVLQEHQTHIEEPRSRYVPAPGVMQPRPVFQAQFIRPNQIEDEQRPVSPLAENLKQYPIAPGAPQPRPVLQTQALQPSQVDDEQKPVSFLDNPGSNVNTMVPSTENQPSLTQNTPQSGFGFNSNGNLYTQQQTLSEAQQQQDRLIEQIRQAQRIRYQHGSSSVLTQQSGLGSAQSGLEVQTAQKPSLGVQEIDSGAQLGQTPESGLNNLDVQNQNKFEEQLKEDLTKQLLLAIDNDWTTLFPNGKHNKGDYSYIYQKLQRDIENNVTKVLTEASEPGQSEYSHLIPSKVTDKPAYIKNLQAQLVHQLCRTLQKELDRKQSIHVRLDDETHNNQYTRHRHQYGHQNYLNQNQDTALELEPLEPQPQHASEVVPMQPIPAQSYNRNVGVKGHFRKQPATKVLQAEENPFLNGEGKQHKTELGVEIENNEASTDVEQVELLSTTQQPLSWWQKFGNKVKSGASKLKEKIVGPSAE